MSIGRSDDSTAALFARAERRLKRCSRADLLVFFPGPVRFSGPTLLGEIRRTEAAFPRATLPRGARVLVQISNPLALLVILPALWRRGCIPILTERTSTPTDAAGIVEGLAPDAVLSDCEEAPADSEILWIPPLPALRLRRPALPRRLLLPAGTVLVRTTSGSTGRPRGVALSTEQILSDARNIVASLRLSEAVPSLAAIPMSHAYGFSTLLTPFLFLGIPMVLLEHPVPELFRKALGRQRTFFFPGVPVLFELLLASSLSDRWLARLSLCISAGAPLPPGTAHRFLERTGVPLRNFYGATECGAIACDRSEAGTALPGCVGTPLKGVRLTVEARVKRRAPAGSGASGRILVEGKSVAFGYVEAGKRPRLFHGRFATCDRGRRAADGQVFLEGRLDRMINVGGRKVCPEEVEGVLLQAPGVREAVVLGISASLRGEVVAAAVAGGEALREGEVLAFCRGRLAAPRVPRRVLILPELPRTSRGKVDTARLRTLLGDSSGVLES